MTADARDKEEMYIDVINTGCSVDEEEIEGRNNVNLKTYERNQNNSEEQQDCFLYKKSANVQNIKDSLFTLVSDETNTAKKICQGQIKVNETKETSTEFKGNENISDNASRAGLPSSSIFSSGTARRIYLNWLKDRAKSLLVNYNKITNEISQNMPEIGTDLDLHESSDVKILEENPSCNVSFRMDESSECLHSDHLEREVENNAKSPFIVRVRGINNGGCNQSPSINSNEEIKDYKKRTTSDVQKLRTEFETKDTSGTENFTHEFQEHNDHDFEQHFVTLVDKEDSNDSKKLFSNCVQEKIEKYFKVNTFIPVKETNSDLGRKMEEISNMVPPFAQFIKNENFTNGINNSDAIINAKVEREARNLPNSTPISTKNFELIDVDYVVSKNILVCLSGKQLKTGARFTDIYKHLLQQKGYNNVKNLKQDIKTYLNYAVESRIIKKNRNHYVLTENGKRMADIIRKDARTRNTKITKGKVVEVHAETSSVKNRKSPRFMGKLKKSSTSKKTCNDKHKRKKWANNRKNKFKHSKIKNKKQKLK